LLSPPGEDTAILARYLAVVAATATTAGAAACLHAKPSAISSATHLCVFPQPSSLAVDALGADVDAATDGVQALRSYKRLVACQHLQDTKTHHRLSDVHSCKP
jgi:hypothetical protein